MDARAGCYLVIVLLAMISFIPFMAATCVKTRGDKPINFSPVNKHTPDPNVTQPGPHGANPADVTPKADITAVPVMPNPAPVAPKTDHAPVAPKTDPLPVAPKADPDVDRGFDPNFLNTGVMQAWYGQEKELAATCARTLKHLKDTNNPALAERAAKICSLRPMDGAIQETALVLARRAVELGKKSPFLAHFQMALGMAEYRAGNYENADAALLEASRLGKDNYYVSGTVAFYRAMNLARQDKEAEGRKLAESAIASMKPLPSDERNPLVGKTNIDDLVLWMAYKEARELLKLPRS